jgi:pilus assembly protein Flp/PilA
MHRGIHSGCSGRSLYNVIWGFMMRKLVKLFVRDERGVSAMEYAVLAAIVVVALGAMAKSYSNSLQGLFTGLFTSVATAQSNANSSS